MNKTRKITVHALLALIIIFINTYTVWGEDKKQVLFIGSYSYNFESFNKQISGFKQVLDSDIKVHIEYFDYGNYPEKENEYNFYNLLKYKMNKYSGYEAIILAENHAIRFWEKYKDELFKNTPMVFLGADDEELIERALKYDNVYGIKEDILVEENIDLINKLHPNSSIVALIYSSSDKSNELKEFYELQDKYKTNKFSHISLADDGIDLAKEKLKKLDKNTVILEFYTSGINHKVYDNIIKFRKFIDEEVNIPKYTTIDFDINNKFVGGVYTDPTRQGNEASKMINKIVNGQTPTKILIQPTEVNTYVFNYDIMSKFGIKERELPKNAIINNKPKSIWQTHKEFMIAMTTVVTSLVITIFILIKNSIKRKEYEKEILRAKEIAENAHNAQSNFISTISHELRTPVAVIMSCIQLLELNLSKLGNSVKTNNINNTNIIKQNCYRMLKIVNNIIDVAKYDSGFMELKLKNIEIISFMEFIVQLVIPYANSRNVDIIFDTEVEELTIAVDAYMLERIVLNLVSNAIKFSKKEEGKILINVYINNENLVLTVEDNGIGIEEENLDKIFERFIQLEDTINRKNEGNGIGLSLVKSLVKLHKGNIYVKSQVDVGTIFTIELPIIVLEDEYVDNQYLDDDSICLKSTEIEFSDIV